MEGNEGKKPGPPPNPSPFLSIFNAIIIAFAAWFGAWFGAYYARSKKYAELEKEKIPLKDTVEKLSKWLETSSYQVSKEHFISVPQVEELKTLRNYLVQQKLPNKTVVVFGPRGIGKTTMISKAFEHENGVICLSLDPASVENFYSSVLELFDYKHADIDSKTLVKAALKAIKDRGGKAPTLW